MLEILIASLSGVVSAISISIAADILFKNRRVNKEVNKEYEKLLIKLKKISLESSDSEMNGKIEDAISKLSTEKLDVWKRGRNNEY